MSNQLLPTRFSFPYHILPATKSSLITGNVGEVAFTAVADLLNVMAVKPIWKGLTSSGNGIQHSDSKQ